MELQGYLDSEETEKTEFGHGNIHGIETQWDETNQEEADLV